jgi:hypothetical protein
MSETDRDDLKDKLNDFSLRLERRMREFATHGELSDQNQSLVTEIQRRRDRIQTRLESIEAGGTAWDVIKFEIESEFRLLSDELALLEEKLDADEMKHTK